MTKLTDQQITALLAKVSDDQRSLGRMTNHELIIVSRYAADVIGRTQIIPSALIKELCARFATSIGAGIRSDNAVVKP